MENILKLGGETFKVVPNFRMSYNLTKYRNKISTGFDFKEEDKDAVAEIMQLARLKNEEDIDLTKLSPRAKELLIEKGKKDLFSLDEIMDIAKTLTGINEDSEVEKLLDKEIGLTGYDDMISKLIQSISLVFTNVKGISTQGE